MFNPPSTHDRMICYETIVLTWGRLFHLWADICEWESVKDVSVRAEYHFYFWLNITFQIYNLKQWQSS